MNIELFKRIYDEPKNKDGTDKPNVSLGFFDVPEWPIQDYGYEVYGTKDGHLFKITGREITGQDGGTRHWVEPIEEVPDVKAYIFFSEKNHTEKQAKKVTSWYFVSTDRPYTLPTNQYSQFFLCPSLSGQMFDSLEGAESYLRDEVSNVARPEYTIYQFNTVKSNKETV